MENLTIYDINFDISSPKPVYVKALVKDRIAVCRDNNRVYIAYKYGDKFYIMLEISITEAVELSKLLNVISIEMEG